MLETSGPHLQILQAIHEIQGSDEPRSVRFDGGIVRTGREGPSSRRRGCASARPELHEGFPRTTKQEESRHSDYHHRVITEEMPLFTRKATQKSPKNYQRLPLTSAMQNRARSRATRKKTTILSENRRRSHIQGAQWGTEIHAPSRGSREQHEVPDKPHTFTGIRARPQASGCSEGQARTAQSVCSFPVPTLLVACPHRLCVISVEVATMSTRSEAGHSKAVPCHAWFSLVPYSAED